MTRVRPGAARRHRVIAGSAFAAAFLLASANASAQDFSLGAGAGLTRGKTDCVASFPCDRADAGIQLFAAYRVADAFDLQLLYADTGRFKGGDTTALGTAFGGDFRVGVTGLTAGYRWGFAPQWALRLRAGVASVRTRFEYAAPFAGSVSRTTTQPIAGVGLAYEVAPGWEVSLDGDATRFEAYTTRGSLQMLGLAVRYSF